MICAYLPNLTIRTDPRGTITTYTYDSLNRLATKSYNDTTPSVSYFYDAAPSSLPSGSVPSGFNFQYTLGRTTAVFSPATTRELATGLFHTYDIGGRIARSSQLLEGQHYTTNSQYNEASLPTAHTYPSSRTIAHSYNVAGQITDVFSNSQPISQLVSYTATGAIKSHMLGNGLYHQMQYNSRLQPTQITLGNGQSGQAAESIWKQEYNYAAYGFDDINGATTTAPTISNNISQNNGNIGHIKLTPGNGTNAINQFFVYDELNRLKLAKEFTQAPTPQINSLSNPQGGKGTTFPLTIYGNNLSNTQQVTFTPNDGITVSNISSTNTEVNLTISIAIDAPLSERQVKVTTPAGESNQLAFTVTENFNCTAQYALPPTITGDMTYVVSTDGEIVGVSAQAENGTVMTEGSAEFDIDMTDPNLSPDTTVFANWFLVIRTNASTSGQATLRFFVGGQLVATKTLFASTDANGNTTTNGQGFPGFYFLNASVDGNIRQALSAYVGSHVIARVEVEAQATTNGQNTVIAEGGLGGFALFTTCGSFVPRFSPRAGFKALNKYSSLFPQSQPYQELNSIEPQPLVDNASWSQEYQYDRFGNRNRVIGTKDQTLSISQSKNRITDSGYQYDLAGNLIADPSGKLFFYDAENRLIKVAKDLPTNIIAEYFYDANGWRIKKADILNSKITRFVYDQGGRLLTEYDGEPVPTIDSPTREHIYGVGGMLATVEVDKINYHTPDHLGSSRVLTNDAGNIISRRDFLPYGEQLSDSIGNRTSVFGYNINDAVKQRFTGYFRDEESDLDFAKARYFTATFGRFMSLDPGSAGATDEDPQSWNGYAYGRNNPTLYVDPNGLKFRLTDNSGNSIDNYSDKDFKKNFTNNKDIKLKDGKIYLKGEQIGTYERLSFDDLSYSANQLIFGLGARAKASNQMIIGFAAVSLNGIGIGQAGTHILLNTIGTTAFVAQQINQQSQEQYIKLGVSATANLPNMDGLSRPDARNILNKNGFVFKGFTDPGGYEKWYHPDGSRVMIGVDGEIDRTPNKADVVADGLPGGKKSGYRIDPSNGKVVKPHTFIPEKLK